MSLLDEVLNGPRNKFILKAFSASFIARIMGFLSTLIITPLVFSYLNSETFGVWSILIGFTAYLGFADLGLGNGLLNYLIKERAEGNYQRIKIGISSTFMFLTATSLVLFLTFGLIGYLTNWKVLLGSNLDNLNLIIPIVSSIFLLNIPLAIIQKIEFAWMHNQVFHIWESIQKLIVIILIFLVIHYELPWYYLPVAYFLPANLTNFFNILYYKKLNEEIKLFAWIKDASNFNYKSLKTIIDNGLIFFFMSLAYLFGRSIDKLLLGIFGNLEIVGAFEIISKPFEISLVFIMMLTSTLWPAFGDAIHKKDYIWIKKALMLSISLLVILYTLFIIIMTSLGNDILQIWLNQRFDFSDTIFTTFGFYSFLLAIFNVFAALFNASNILKFQLWIFICFAIISIPLKLLGLTYEGLQGFVLGNLIAFCLAIILPTLIKFRQIYYV